jgi:hypothetical protein
MPEPLFTLAGGVVFGVLLAYLLYKITTRGFTVVNLPDPDIEVRCISPTQVQITGSIDVAPAGTRLTNLHVVAYEDGHPVPASPEGQGATPCGTAFPITYTLPTLNTARIVVAVWAEFQANTSDSFELDSCSGSGLSGSGSGSDRLIRSLPGGAAEQLEAVPRAYRVSPGSPPAGATGGPALPPEAVLRYDPEVSTPLEPVWQARGEPGAVREWTLCLLHRHSGFGALLSVVCLVGGREVRLTWVTSDWRFHAPNRLAPESDDPGVPALVVSPA